MQPITIDDTHRSVCWTHGWAVQYGWTDRDAVWGLTYVGPRNQVLDGVKITTWERAILGVIRPTEKHWSLSCGVCSKRVIHAAAEYHIT